MTLEILILSLYNITLLVLFVFALYSLSLLYFKARYAKKEEAVMADPRDAVITIQLPLYNEQYVAKRLIDAVCRIDHPKDKLEIQVLDDSTDATVNIVAREVERWQKEGFDIKQIRRKNRKGYKAGALKEGLKTAKGEFIAIFDADFIPHVSFLKDTLPRFTKDNIGMVQCRWGHLNENYSILTRVQAAALNGHFILEQFVRNQAGFFINFNGTGGVWRKSCIEDAGNWHDDTIAEDLDLSYRAQLKGWKFVYLKDITVPAELPSEMKALKAQQFRWTKGTIETAKKTLPALWRSDIPLRIKIQSTFHLTNNIVFPFILLTGILNVPVVFIKESGEYNAVFNFMSLFTVAMFSTFWVYMTAQKDSGGDWKSKLLLFPLYLAGSMGFAVNNTKAFFEGIMNKKSEFVRTPKFNIVKSQDQIKDTKYLAALKVDYSVFIELFLAAYCFVGVVSSIIFLELAALPFNFMFFAGFSTVSIMSLKNSPVFTNLWIKFRSLAWRTSTT